MVASALAALLLTGGCRGQPAPVPAPDDPGLPEGVTLVPGGGAAADLAATHAFFASRPPHERPWGDGLEPVAGVASLSAEACGTCHPAQLGEWRVSVHAQAWIDPQYQAEIGKSGNRWLCLNCHTPLLVQQDLWPRDLVDDDVERPVVVRNPLFDSALRDEGITCAACHVRGDAIHGPGTGGEAPHPVVADPDFRSGALCIRCHQVRATYEGKDFLCTFDTGKEWRDGPWDDEGETCVTCHMPAHEAPAARGAAPKTVRRHWWRGAGIPKVAGRYPPPEANAFGLDLRAEADGPLLRLHLENARAGHMLPTGDPERWVQVDVTFRDEAGTPVDSWSHRIGQVWTWQPTPAKQSDNRLAPREVRTLEVPMAPGAVAADIRASSHRISDENARYHGLEDYPRSVETHRLTVRRTPPPP